MNPRRRRRLVLYTYALVIAGVATGAAYAPGWWARRAESEMGAGVFEVKPYLQLGDNPTTKPDGTESLALLWQTADADADWSVETRAGANQAWTKGAALTMRRVAVNGIAPFRVHHALMTGLTPGGTFAYRVTRGGKAVFEANATARKPAGRPHRFVVFGDCAEDTEGQRAVALQTDRARPDYVVVTGDIVYNRGRISEYLTKFFPIYNHDVRNARAGVPLLRSTLFLAAPGNHDLVFTDFDVHPDALGYYYYWDIPRNGPLTDPEGPNIPKLKGDPERRRAFLDATAPAFPRSSNFSFDYGDAHWTVLDSNYHADWTDPALIAWLVADLAAARRAPWRFVAYHHPGFNGSKAHFDDQRTRVLAPILEAGKVDVVFNGHVHNYQRSDPLTFIPTPQPSGSTYGPNGQVAGKWTLDKAFDGVTKTKPVGVVYLVSGGGGARLYNPEQQDDPASWQPFTRRFVSKEHSLTVVDVTPAAITIRQVGADGEEIDRFVITR